MDRQMLFISINTMTVVVFLMTYYVNKISNNGIIFGVRLPLEFLKEEELIHLEKSYKRVTLIVYFLMLIIFNFVGYRMGNLSDESAEGFTAIFIVTLLIVSNVIFIPFYYKTKRLKRERGWSYKKRNVVVTDTSLRKPKKDEKYKVLNSNIFLVLCIVPIILTLLTILRYSGLPDVINIPNTSFGNFEKRTLKGFIILFQFPLSQLAMIILMYFINKIIISSRVDLNSGALEAAVIRKKKFRRTGSIMMFATTLEMVVMFTFSQLSILYGFNIMLITYIFTAVISLTAFVFIFAFVKIGQGGRNLQGEEKDELYKDDDDNWILGGMYFNRNDPAWMVEKRRGIGWTVNFANPKAWLAIGGLVIFIIINIVISIAVSK